MIEDEDTKISERVSLIIGNTKLKNIQDKLIKLQKYYGPGFQIPVPFFDNS